MDFSNCGAPTGMLAAEQALHFGMGAEALAADVLIQDAQIQPDPDDLGAPWAQATQPLPITPDNNPEGRTDRRHAGRIGRHAGTLQFKQSRALGAGRRNRGSAAAGAIPAICWPRSALSRSGRAWRAIGSIRTSDVGNPDGAEDAVYTSQTPPYRTGNWPMMSPSELMNLPGFGADRYRKIAPYVTALPNANTTINLCTAPALVLESLVEGLNGEWSSNPAVLTNGRKTGCFPDVKTFTNVATSFAGTKSHGKHRQSRSVLKAHTSSSPRA